MTPLATGPAATTAHLEADTPAALATALESFLRNYQGSQSFAVVASFAVSLAQVSAPVHQQTRWVGSELRQVDIFLEYHLILAATERGA